MGSSPASPAPRPAALRRLCHAAGQRAAGHPSQKIEALAGGESELTLTLGSLEEIERWVLSWGEHVQVLESLALKKQIRRVAETILSST